MASASTKDQLRQRFGALRRGMTTEEVRLRSARITEHVLGLPEIESASRVHAYWPMQEQNEVDTRPIIDALVARGVMVVLPVVASFDAGDPQMTHRAFRGRADLTMNTWKIAEPMEGPEVDPQTLDAVLVPALGAGRSGHRIGHGWGYYDRFLSQLSPAIPRILPAYGACLLPEVPHDPHDEPVHRIVTESGVVTVSHPEATVSEQP